nr:DNA-3-methyladenine glycosylase 2 family protein [uncultured Rhodopila sp.]
MDPGAAFAHPPAEALAAIGTLIDIDPDFAAILQRAGPLPWRRRTPGFPGLLQAIVAQMISNQAAAAIWGRVRAIPGALDPASMMDLPDDVLRAAGLSRPKVIHARALAAAFLDGTLSADQIELLDDEAAIVTIGSIKGMGRWTAEIYLLFALGRLDVFPSGDIALAAALADLKALPERPGPKALREIATAWAPVRSLAARLLWHHWRHVTGRPAMDDIKLL